MVSKMNMLVLMVFLGAAIQGCSAQTPPPASAPVTHTVGDAIGWNVPGNGSRAYELWAANKTFMVGDILVFNFLNLTHNVAEVTKSAFDSCDTSTTISLATNPPVRITLATSGEHFYTCTFPSHCSLDQKLAINVTSGSAPTPSPSPAATPSSPPPAPTPTSSPPSTATPPPSTATPPSSSTTPPPSTATPPSSSTTPPPPTATTPSPTGSTTPPPAGNSATSLSVTGLFSGILSIAVVLLY